jgi:hypothetical protein
MPRDIVTTETCNGRCHQPLAIHGGQRTDIEVCVLCHNPSQSIDPDTGNSVDMPLMTHKIHMGENLANGYVVIGYGQSVHDYSDVVYPGVINDCAACHTGGTPTEDFPLVATPERVQSCNQNARGATTFTWDYDVPIQIRLAENDRLVAGGGPSGSVSTGNWVRDGMVFNMVERDSGALIQSMTLNTTVQGCVSNIPGAPVGIAGTDHTAWLTNPRIDSCGSCHDDVNFETGENHSDFNLVAPDDSECALCHRPSSGMEFDRSIKGAHVPDFRSVQIDNVLIDIVEVTNSGPGEFPSVVFNASDKFGPVDPNTMNRLRFSINGPNEDFDYYLQEDALGAVVRMGNRWVYTFETPIPDDATGSFSVGVEGRTPIVVNPGLGSEFSTQRQVDNFLMPFAVTDTEPMARRLVVSDENCETCHGNLSLHGDNRRDAQYCTTCHYPAATDEAVRPEESLPPENIGMKFMVHKIHAGAELENGYVVYGYRGTQYDFGHIEYTGDLANCEGCHVENSQQLPLPAGVLPSDTPWDFLAQMGPETAACLSCHDDLSSAVHADANTTMIGESCSTCHGEGREFSVDRVHAR